MLRSSLRRNACLAPRGAAALSLRPMQPLRIETFSNAKGGNAFYKAVTHPKTAAGARDLLRRLAQGGKVAVYDPLGFAEGFAAVWDLAGLDLARSFVQDVD